VIADILWFTALFAATLWIISQLMGSSPAIWEDTLIENLFISDCLVNNRCTAVGAGATVGIFHSATYLHFRSMLNWLGVDADGTYRLFLAMNAFGVVLVALAARRLGGRVASAIAAVIMVASIGIPTQLNVISDVAPVPFLGAVFLLVAVAATARPSLGMTAVLGTVGGVMVNVYATGMLCGVSALWTALLIPERRRAHAAVAVASFAGSTFLLSPLTWIVNARILLSRPVGNAQSMAQHHLFAMPMVWLTTLAILIWAAAAVSRRPGMRRRLDVPAALFIPLFVPLVLGTWTGKLDPQGKYFSHVIGGVAVGVAGGVALVGRGLWRWVTLRVPWFVGPAGTRAGFEGVVLCVTLALIATGRITYSPTNDVINFPVFTYRDVASAARVLGRERGWSWFRAHLNVRTPDEIVRRATLRWAGGWPESGQTDTLERAYLLKVPRHMVPQPRPANVVIAASTPRDVTLLTFACSWIDWRSFRACVRRDGSAEETCTQSGITAARDGHLDYQAGIPGMPNPGGNMFVRQTMTLHLPLHPTDRCPETWVHMPQLFRLCPGRIVAVDGGTSQIEADGQWARLSLHGAPGAAPPRELSIAWDLGGPQCWNEYRGYPPFFVEGDPQSVTFMMEAFDRQTGRLTGPRSRAAR
jgi:hypothetical protein